MGASDGSGRVSDGSERVSDGIKRRTRASERPGRGALAKKLNEHAERANLFGAPIIPCVIFTQFPACMGMVLAVVLAVVLAMVLLKAVLQEGMVKR